MINARKISKAKKTLWDVLRSPKTVALLKIGAAVVGVIHAIEELRSTPASTSKIGFKLDTSSDEED